ncbi:MAG: LysM peptidoglycan-binding domain-containing protein [Burkholderiales bacterium]|nr:LysM peptidoglycan-binding domain-containing protein [Anaerolineae bacterium]
MSSWLSRNLRHSLLMVALLAAAVVLSGCFRQAGEEFNPESQPIGETVGEPTIAPSFTPEDSGADTLIVITEEPISPNTDVVTEEPETDAFSSNSDLPPITVLAPTRATFGEPSTLPTVQSGPTSTTGAPQVFITPGAPMGPITITPALAGTLPGGALTSTPSGLITPTSPVTLTECNYTVESGDNLYQIGLAHDATLEEIRAANPDLEGENPILDIGQVLTLPNCQPGLELASPSGEDTTTQTQSGGPQVSPPDAPAPPGSNSAPVSSVGGTNDSGIVGTGSNPSGVQTYTVETGDTLFLIAQEFGTTVDEIIAVNDLEDPDRLDVGQVIIIP